MQEIRELRERTRSALLKSRASHKSINKRQIPTTKQKGVDESRMSQIDRQKFKLSSTKWLGHHYFLDILYQTTSNNSYIVSKIFIDLWMVTKLNCYKEVLWQE